MPSDDLGPPEHSIRVTIGVDALEVSVAAEFHQLPEDIGAYLAKQARVIARVVDDVRRKGAEQ